MFRAARWSLRSRRWAEGQPSWEEVVQHAEHGEPAAIIAQGRHVAGVVPSGERDRLHATIALLADTELVRDLRAA